MTALVSAQDIAVYTAKDLMERVSGPDSFYIVNFWATWCGPCVRELPEFEKMRTYYEGKPVKILLVSTDFREDYPKKLQSFIRKRRLRHEVVWLNETNANEFIPRIEAAWSGSIPATLLLYPRNQYRNFFEGMVSARQLTLLIDKQLAY